MDSLTEWLGRALSFSVGHGVIVTGLWLLTMQDRRAQEKEARYWKRQCLGWRRDRAEVDDGGC